MNTTIPEELLEQVEEGNVLLFIGECIVHDAAGDRAFEQLAAQLVMRAGICEAQGLTFAQIAQLYEDEKGTHELLLFVKRYFEELGNEPQAVHRLIAQLTDCTILATTCFDGRLEQAFEEVGRPLNRIIGNVDVAFEQEGRPQLYKLRGSLERIESLVLTEDAYETFFEDHASISLVLQGYLARKTMLFVGYDLTDPHFKRLYRKVTVSLDNFQRRAYAFGAAPPAHIASWARRHEIEVIEADVTHFLELLTAQLAARKAAARRVLSLPKDSNPNSEPDALPERPYKFLDYYEAKDAGIFYGRRQETQHLCALIHAHRLVLLYGASGVGKTSLLLAGAVPRLKQSTQPYHAIYIRALEDPTFVIRQTLRRQLPDAKLPDSRSLVDFLAAVTKTLGQTLVIVLDQFEEFFIRLSPQFRAAFISELGALYDARDVPVKVIFSLREDWLASMDEIEERIPCLFRTRMRVSRLTEIQAQQAITEPVKQLGISYEPALLERLLADLLGSNEEVMPPQLQLICSALYDGRREQDRVLKIATYERLGGVQGVLQRYLEEELSHLDPIKQALARGVLEELVTSEKTKAVKSSAELALALEAHLETLESVLERLVRGRLLRTVKDETGQKAYELAHEYLIHEISLTADSQARKEAEELLQQEVENGQRFGTVLAADKLALIGDVRDTLRLNDDAQALLLKSALQVGQDIEYWLNRIPEPTCRVELLTKATQNRLTIVRQRAIEALGSQDVPQAVAPLLTLALHDRNMDIRDTARQSLAQLTTQQPAIVERLKEEVARSTQAENPTNRAALLRTLTYLPLSGLPLTLRLEVFMMRIRLRMTWFIQASLLTPQRRAMAMTTGLLVVLVAFAYAFSMNSYHVGTKPSGIPGKNIVVIRRGHPQLNLPGIDKVLVETDINAHWIADEHWEAANNGSICGFSIPTVEGDYYKWGQEVAEVLKLEHRVPMLWYLGQQEDARQALLEAMRESDTELHLTSVRLLGDMVKLDPDFVNANRELVTKRLIEVLKLRLWEPESGPQSEEEWELHHGLILAVGQIVQTHPELVEPLMPALLSRLEDNEPHALAYTIGQVVEADSQQGKQLINTLRQWLSDEDSNTRGIAMSLVEPVIQANSEFAEQLIDPLLLRLEDEQSHIRVITIDAVRAVVETNLQFQLTEQALQALGRLLEDEESYVRVNAASLVIQVSDPNSQLAEQARQALRRLLEDEDEDSHVRVNAARAVIQVVEPNSQLAEQALQALRRLLKDEDSYVRASATNVVWEVNPQLAEQLMPVLLQLLKDNNSNVRNNALSAVEPIVKANSELAEQALQALLPRLEDEDEESHVRANAVYLVGRVVQANSELAEALMPTLLRLLEDEDEDSHVRVSAASVVMRVVEPNSELPEKLMPTLLRLLEDEESDVRASAVYAVYAVSQVVEPNAELPEELMPTLLRLLEDEDRNVRASVMDVVEQVYTDQKYEAFLFDKLTDPQNALARFPAAQALFRITLEDPIRGQGIDSRLKELAESLEPMERIWANKTLPMLDLATEAHKVAQLEGKEREEAMNKLNVFAQWDRGRDSSRVDFFGEEFSWAAEQAVTWLWEQGNEGNLQTATK